MSYRLLFGSRLGGGEGMKFRQVLGALRKNLSLNFRFLRRSSHRYKSVVEKYPDRVSAKAPLDMFSSFKGYLTNDLEKCMGCGVCVPACPVQAISLTSESQRDGSISVQEFRIHLGKCFSCGVCIEVCPEASLSYSKEFEMVSDSSRDLVAVFRNSGKKKEKDISRIRTYEVRR
jgi:formate hydrogenlyase subunit 6/NADH:ubiquinone oxidoreductase subunit I